MFKVLEICVYFTCENMSYVVFIFRNQTRLIFDTDLCGKLTIFCCVLHLLRMLVIV